MTIRPVDPTIANPLQWIAKPQIIRLMGDTNLQPIPLDDLLRRLIAVVVSWVFTPPLPVPTGSNRVDSSADQQASSTGYIIPASNTNLFYSIESQDGIASLVVRVEGVVARLIQEI
jgi:hypothetical protein